MKEETVEQLKNDEKLIKVLSLFEASKKPMKTSKVRRIAEKMGYTFKVRTQLRKLEDLGFLGSRRPLAPDSLELLWYKKYL